MCSRTVIIDTLGSLMSQSMPRNAKSLQHRGLSTSGKGLKLGPVAGLGATRDRNWTKRRSPGIQIGGCTGQVTPPALGSRFSSVGDISERASSYLESQLGPVYRPSETIYSFLSKNLGSLHFSVLTIIMDLVKESKHFRLDQHVIRKDSPTLGIFKIPTKHRYDP